MSELYKFTGNTSSNSYDFTTDFGIKVKVYFYLADYVFPKHPNFNHLTFTFGTDTSAPVRSDPKVRNTIVYIIYSHFVVQADKILLWVCDNEDGRAAARHRKFLRWFESNKDNDYVKLDAILEVSEDYVPGGSYASIIFQERNPHADEIRDAFNNIGNELDDKGDTTIA